VRLTFVAAAALAALALGAQASARDSCTSGVKTVSGVTYGTFCGKAHATVKHNALFHAKIKLTGGRKHGTFSGTSLADQKPGSGTFSC